MKTNQVRFSFRYADLDYKLDKWLLIHGNQYNPKINLL